jgi:hypothetical protein
MAFRKSKWWGAVKPPSGAVINWGHPLSFGLRARWMMNPDAGLILRESVGKKNGLLTGVSGSVPFWQSGKFGPSLLFPIGTNYVSLPTTIPLFGGAKQWTVSLWINPVTATGSPFGDDLSSFTCYPTMRWSGSNYQFYAGDGAAFFVSGALSSGSVVVGKWELLTGVYDGSATFRIYRNGVLNASPAVTAGATLSTSATTFSISHVAGGSAPEFKGAVDDFCLWSRALTPSEVAQYYADPFCNILEPRRRIISQAAAAAGFNAAWNVGANTVIQPGALQA